MLGQIIPTLATVVSAGFRDIGPIKTNKATNRLQKSTIDLNSATVDGKAENSQLYRLFQRSNAC